MAKPDGGPAFPVPHHKSGYELPPGSSGMTLRQWYAGQALSVIGSIANAQPLLLASAASIASRAFGLADALLAHEAGEREKGGA